MKNGKRKASATVTRAPRPLPGASKIQAFKGIYNSCAPNTNIARSHSNVTLKRKYKNIIAV